MFSMYRMDSYVLAEMFKYLYLLFADEEDLVLDMEQFVFTTEAHLLPISLTKSVKRPTGPSLVPLNTVKPPKEPGAKEEVMDSDGLHLLVCPRVTHSLLDSFLKMVMKQCSSSRFHSALFGSSLLTGLVNPSLFSHHVVYHQQTQLTGAISNIAEY